MTTLMEVAQLVAVSAAFFISVTCISRLRYGNIKFSWAFLYVGCIGHSFWSTCNIIDGIADSRDVTIMLLIGFYMLVTEKAWASAVPKVAQRDVKNLGSSGCRP